MARPRIPQTLTLLTLASVSRPATPLPGRLSPRTSSSSFTTTAARPSHIGRAPLSIPPEVTFRVTETPKRTSAIRAARTAQPLVEIQGPLGKLALEIPSFVRIDHDVAARKASVRVLDTEVKEQRSMWGTVRAILQNHILGVSEGHTTILRLVGVGYRATIETKAITKSPAYEGQPFVSLKVGYSHPIELGVPAGVTASTPQPTRILLQGMEKEVVNQFAAEIRQWRVPEPYKGKGIFVNDETIRLKAKKIK